MRRSERFSGDVTFWLRDSNEKDRIDSSSYYHFYYLENYYTPLSMFPFLLLSFLSLRLSFTLSLSLSTVMPLRARAVDSASSCQNKNRSVETVHRHAVFGAAAESRLLWFYIFTEVRGALLAASQLLLKCCPLIGPPHDSLSAEYIL